MINIKPEKLHLINFTSYKDETIDFQKIISPTLICGDNGHGKSSIIDAITTALYCRARGCDSRGAGIDDLINKTAKEFTVDYTFTMNNHKYQIVRSKSKSSHKLSFFIDDYDHSSSIKETQQKIIDTIKIDYNTFIDTVCIAQNKSSSFMEKSPKDRKEVFAQILNLDDYDVLEKYAREIRKTLVAEYNSLQDELTSLNNKVALKNEYQEKLIKYQYNVEQINIDSLQLKLESLLILKSQQDTIKSKNTLILNQRNQLITMIKRYENIISNSKKELQSIVLIDIDQLQQELDSYSLQLNQVTAEIEQLQNLINDYIVKVSILKKEINIVKTKKQNIQNYNKAICDFCGNTITEEYKQEYINSLNSEGKNIYNQITELSAIINDKQSQLNIKKDIYNELNEKIKVLNRKIQSANIDKNRYITLQQNIENNTDELNHLLIDLEKNKKEVIESINEIDENEIVSLKENINRLTNEKNTYLSKIAIIQDRLKQIDEYIVKIKQLEMDLKSRALILDDYKSLINAFSKSGIQSYIIENTLPEIETEINTILKDLTNDKISVSFIIQKETKSKTLTDTLDILVNDSNISRKYETFSGGEKFRIDFACHIALSRFLARRANASIDLFILDENLGSQDETAKEIFIQCLTKLNKYFKQILIITHINDIKEAFENKIIVKKDDLGSHILFQ